MNSRHFIYDHYYTLSILIIQPMNKKIKINNHLSVIEPLSLKIEYTWIDYFKFHQANHLDLILVFSCIPSVSSLFLKNTETIITQRVYSNKNYEVFF